MIEKFDHANWASIRYKLTSKYPQLTKADLVFRDGTESDLLRMIAIRLGKTSRELQKELQSEAE